MTNRLRTSIIATLTVILSVLLMFVIATNINVVKADEIEIPSDVNAPRVSGDWTDDFYVIDGASVRLETEAIKFTTVVTNDFVEYLESQGEVEFFATAKQVGSSKVVARPYASQPKYATMGDTFDLNTYLNFDNYVGNVDDVCAIEFVVETYAKVTPTSGTPIYYRAYKPEGNDIARSMRAVANMASINGDVGLENYYKERVDIHKGYGVFVKDTEIDNVNHIDVLAFKDITINEPTVELYVDAAKYTCAVSDGVITLPQLKNLDANGFKYVTIFANDKAYTAKVDVCTTLKELNSANREEIFNLTDEYVVFTGDLEFPDFEMQGTSYNNSFSGVLDGKGFSMGDIRCRNNLGVFMHFSGTIKNTHIMSRMRGGNAGVLAYEVNGDAFVQNVVVNGYNAQIDVTNGFICYNVHPNTNLYVENMVGGYGTKAELSIGHEVMDGLQGYVVGINSGNIVLDNCHFNGYSGRVVGDEENSSGSITDSTTYTVYDSEYKLFEQVFFAIDDVNVVEKTYNMVDYASANHVERADEVVSAGNDINVEKYLAYIETKGVDTSKWIYQDNITDLSNANSGEWYLIGDIDMANVSGQNSELVGTFDGRNHVVKNFKPSQGGYFFFRVSGTFKNVAFVNLDLSNSSLGAGIALIGNGSWGVTFENVFVLVSSSVRGESSSCFLGDVYGGQTYKFSDVFVYDMSESVSNSNTLCGVLVGRHEVAGSYVMSNCHFVVNSEVLNPYSPDGLIANNAGTTEDRYVAPSSIGTKGVDYFMYDDVKDVNVGEDSTLTEFIKSCISKYITQE